MIMNLLFLDTETGGLDPLKYSILSVGLAIISTNSKSNDGNIDIVDRLEIPVKEPDICVHESALKVNRIDMSYHNKIAKSPEVAVKEIIDFISRNNNIYSDKNKIILFGHNVYFDVNFIIRLFNLTSYKYSDYFSHRVVDTSSILRFLYLNKTFDHDISNLDAALDYYNINEYPRHTSLQDAILTAKLFKRLLMI